MVTIVNYRGRWATLKTGLHRYSKYLSVERVESSTWLMRVYYIIQKTLFYSKILSPSRALKNDSFPNYSLVLFKLPVDLNDEYRNHGSFCTVSSVYQLPVYVIFRATCSFALIGIKRAYLLLDPLGILVLFFLVAICVPSYLFCRVFRILN